jgi:probable phosphoglycerate mutase
VNPPELLLIRHGESEWNARGLWQGHADPPLSPDGWSQAEALVNALAGEAIDRIEASDLRRARQTAEPLAAARGLAIRTDPLYRELDLGEWSGLTREQILARGDDVFELFVSRSPDAAAPGGESRRQLWDRARSAVASLCERCPGERVAVVTHGGFVYACFPEVDATNASVHRAPADLLLERIECGLGSARSDAY